MQAGNVSVRVHGKSNFGEKPKTEEVAAPAWRDSPSKKGNREFMATAKLIHAGPGEGAAYSAVGDVYRLLATGEQTGGVYTLAEVRVSPDNGPPPHIHHREDEAFFVVEGEVTFQLGDRKVKGKPGTFVQGPRGVPHAFKNTGKSPARMLVYVTPPGFENFLKEFATPLPVFDSPPAAVTPADIDKLLAIAPKYGIEILPPPK